MLADRSGGSGRPARWMAVRWLIHSVGANRSAAGRTITGTVIATLIVCLAVSVWSGNQSRTSRGRSQTPAYAFGGHEFDAQIQSVPFGGDIWTNVYISDVHPDAPIAPGLSRLPRPGEAYVSPEIAKLVEEEPALAKRIPAKIVGTVGRAGLQSPDELFAVVGLLARQNRGAGPKSGWGSPVPAADRGGIPGTPFLLILALLVGLPLLVFAQTISHLSEESRRRRLAALHLLGVPSRALTTAVRTEVSLLLCCGNLVGLAVGILVTPWLSSSGIIGMTWFVPPAVLNWLPTLLVIGVLDFVCLVAVGRRTRHDLLNPLQSRTGHEREPTRLRVIPLLLGLSMLAYLFFADSISGPRLAESNAVRLLYVGAGLSVIGSSVALPRLIADVAELIPDRVRGVAIFVASRRLRASAFATAKVTAATVAVIVAGMVGLAAITDLGGLDTPTKLGEQYVLTLSGYGSLADQQAALSIRSEASLLSLPSVRGVVPVNVANCRSLERMVGLSSLSGAEQIERSCRPGWRVRLVDADSGLIAGLRLPASWDGAPLLAVKGLDAAGIPQGPLIAESPDLISKRVRGANLTVYPGTGPKRVAQYMNKFLSRDPLASVVDTSNSSYHYLIPVLRGVLVSCVVVGVLLAGCAIVFVMGDQKKERAKISARMRVLGAPVATLRRIAMVQALFANMCSVILAVILGSLAGNDYVLVGATGADFSPNIRLMVGLGAAVVIVLAALSFFLDTPGRDLDPEVLRNE